MKHLNLPHVDNGVTHASQIPQVLDSAHVEWQPVDCNNWPEDYPYSPSARFRIAYTDDAFLVEYQAHEETVRAYFANDNGDVWTDSCMEFFLAPNPDDGIYYNLECNCIGTVLLGVRGRGVDKAHASAQVLGEIDRWASLGHVAFEEYHIRQPWRVALRVPFSAYWHHNIVQRLGQDERTMRANFYKCGDGLERPHFLSWAPIVSDKPNFHLPDFFGEITLK